VIVFDLFEFSPLLIFRFSLGMSVFRTRSFFALSLLACSSLFLTQCNMVGPDYTEPESITPDLWNQSLPGASDANTAALQTWWRHFDDPVLNDLIRKAEASNLDLVVAGERVLQARANRNATRSVLFPQVNGTGSFTRGRLTENGLNPPPIGGSTNEIYDLGLNAGWELDFWGKNRRLVEAAKASEAARVEIFFNARLSLFTEVAIAYIELQTVKRRIEITRDNLKTQKGSVTIARDRLDAGLVPELDVSQAEANQANTEAVIPQLHQQRVSLVNRLAALLGTYPGKLEPMLSKGSRIPVPPESVARGLPADLIRARPDIRAAERNLAAANAGIGSATADLYPQFQLGGNFTLQAAAPGDVLDSGSRNTGFGPKFTWNLFNAGRIRNLIEINKAETRAAYATYEQTVINAVSEVETAMARLRYERERQASLGRAVKAAKRSRELIKESYKDGLLPFQNVLDSERVVLLTEDSHAASRGQIAAAYASLYKALGGGSRPSKK
jgi:NodT family efflux transporter outer membrane factor (OMF) lipoprotein